MGENREHSYTVNGVRKFKSIEQMKDWIWDKRSYDFLIEDALISQSVWREYCNKLAKQRKRWREIAKKLFKGK